MLGLRRHPKPLFASVHLDYYAPEIDVGLVLLAEHKVDPARFLEGVVK